MDSKSLLRLVLLNFTLSLLAPMVSGCVNLFAVQGATNGVDQQTWLDGRIWDGGAGKFTQVCTLQNYPDSNGNYEFSCMDGYSAYLDDPEPYLENGYLIKYGTPHGQYSFIPEYTQCGGEDVFCSMWRSCQYGCSDGSSDCFVDNCSEFNYNGCNAP